MTRRLQSIPFDPSAPPPPPSHEDMDPPSARHFTTASAAQMDEACALLRQALAELRSLNAKLAPGR